MPASISADASMICARQSRALVAEQALQLAQRLAALPLGVGVDQIVETFDLGEIELAVLERAAGEFAGLRRPHILECRERGEQRGQHRAAAVDLQFGDVLAGRAGRPRKPEHHRLVDRLPLGVAQQRPRRHPRRRHFAGQRRQRRLRPADPETRTTAIALGGRPDDSAKMVWSRGCIAYLCRSP